MSRDDPYRAFLEAKIAAPPCLGLPCEAGEVSPILLPHQRACVVWAVRGGRRGLAERNALPKTFSVLKPGTLRDDVWTDVSRMRTLNSEQVRRRVEQHICPLQFDIVDRLIRLYSNADELVLDPFAGLGTVPMRAVKLGRRGAGVELDPKSFRDAVHYCREAEAGRMTPSLFDLIEAQAA